jgi:hypothetical protein
MRGVAMVGQTLSCEPGTWSYSPTFTFLFIDSATGQILQQGTLGNYVLSSTDVGRTILCEVRASNAGGTGIGRVGPTAAINAAPAPPVSEGTGSAPGAIHPAPVNKQAEEEFWAHPPWQSQPTAASHPASASESGAVSLAGSTIAVSGGRALVRLHCHGHTTCAGRLMLTGSETLKHGGHRLPRSVTLATGSFSIAGESTKTVDLALSSRGRGLLRASGGHLAASLSMTQRQPTASRAEQSSVRLVEELTQGKKRHGRK